MDGDREPLPSLQLAVHGGAEKDLGNLRLPVPGEAKLCYFLR
ncbi:MAG: hypothetical protein QF450_11215 [Rhodospirillales bacterium]|jgi:hypothetical protein|nr:hypothetical protein [Rhodospirillales bacterium]